MALCAKKKARVAPKTLSFGHREDISPDIRILCGPSRRLCCRLSVSLNEFIADLEGDVQEHACGVVCGYHWTHWANMMILLVSLVGWTLLALFFQFQVYELDESARKSSAWWGSIQDWLSRVSPSFEVYFPFIQLMQILAVWTAFAGSMTVLQLRYRALIKAVGARVKSQIEKELMAQQRRKAELEGCRDRLSRYFDPKDLPRHQLRTRWQKAENGLEERLREIAEYFHEVEEKTAEETQAHKIWIQTYLYGIPLLVVSLADLTLCVVAYVRELRNGDRLDLQTLDDIEKDPVAAFTSIPCLWTWASLLVNFSAFVVLAFVESLRKHRRLLKEEVRIVADSIVKHSNEAIRFVWEDSVLGELAPIVQGRRAEADDLLSVAASRITAGPEYRGLLDGEDSQVGGRSNVTGGGGGALGAETDGEDDVAAPLLGGDDEEKKKSRRLFTLLQRDSDGGDAQRRQSTDSSQRGQQQARGGSKGNTHSYMMTQLSKGVVECQWVPSQSQQQKPRAGGDSANAAGPSNV
uniref:Transmembrane protein n=1 Tax=Chromera velia CCMP2878 TaxID=1169474 RepID=A0A0G4G3M7_9ALVE|eukprot:Cvel_20036.t1-p1 / transcript=Cvel_20036.t1 / gene=Cvel_20036 / organism=Chromera_velia_CCMP2878 / gene_product=hypothetical protein / transcript_product=hypothetical protein / location=Cvel_scaffold1770:8291-13784(+) / protein_length=521 / sequence_SO=supercontig / SO=protein_coding / is_pseudo=false